MFLPFTVFDLALVRIEPKALDANARHHVSVLPIDACDHGRVLRQEPMMRQRMERSGPNRNAAVGVATAAEANAPLL